MYLYFRFPVVKVDFVSLGPGFYKCGNLCFSIFMTLTGGGMGRACGVRYRQPPPVLFVMTPQFHFCHVRTARHPLAACAVRLCLLQSDSGTLSSESLCCEM